MATGALEVLVDDAVFGESPRWHQGALWFSDIGGNKVWRVAPDGRRELVLAGVLAPSGLGWTAAGDMLVASLHDHAIHLLPPGGVARVFCGPRAHGTLGTNDMATAQGRSYVSCAGRAYRAGDTMAQIAAPVGRVIMVEHATASARIVAQGYRMPNGIVVSPDRKRLIFSELFGSRLLQFDIAPDGSLENETVFAALSGYADGICMDAHGAIWAAIGAGGPSEWQRVAPGGRILDRIPAVAGYACVACALGGADGRDLFLVANRTEAPEDVFNGRAKSQVLRARTEVPGVIE